jgi:hypothetical protein
MRKIPYRYHSSFVNHINHYRIYLLFFVIIFINNNNNSSNNNRSSDNNNNDDDNVKSYNQASEITYYSIANV